VSLYTELFSSLDRADAYYQQEIVGDLISKVGTGGGGAITDGALLVLEKLASVHPDRLVAFTTMITAMMEFTEAMNLGQFRQLMRVLCSLAWQDNRSDNSGLLNELNMMMRKQIRSRSLNLKKMGVIGVVCAVRAIGASSSKQGNSGDKAGGRSSSGGSSAESDIMKLIDMATKETEAFPEAAGLLMDELASPALIADLPLAITNKASGLFQGIFENSFVDDFVKNKTENSDLGLPLKLAFQLDQDEVETEDDDEETGVICIPIAKWVLQSKHNPLVPRTEMFRFIPNFRLMAALRLKQTEDEDEIDALLSCGVLMVPTEHLNGQTVMNTRETESVLDILFLACNWFREVLNYFTVLTDPEIQTQVKLRLKNLLEVEGLLKRLLVKAASGYRPPTILFSEDLSSWTPPSSHAGKDKETGGKKNGGKGKKSSKGKQKKGMNDTTLNNQTMHLNTQPGGTQHKPVAHSTMINSSDDTGKAAPTADLSVYRPFFREFDLQLYNILSYDVVTTASVPDWEEERLEPRFRPEELLYLLKDLSGKLERRLAGGQRKGFPGGLHAAAASTAGSTNIMALSELTLIEKVAEVLPKIFANLDILRDYFTTLIRLNDGVMDTPNLFSAEANLYSACLRTGMDIAVAFFSWNGFQSTQMEAILTNTLKELVGRIEHDSSGSIPHLAEKTVNYLDSFTQGITNCEVAASHLKLLQALEETSGGGSRTIRACVSRVAGIYARRSWQNAAGKEKGAKFNSQVEKFFRVLLEEGSEDPTQELTTLLQSGVQDVFETKTKDYTNAEFQTVSRGSLGVIYRVVFNCLVRLAKKNTYAPTRDKEELLDAWTSVINLLDKAVAHIKVWRNRSILLTVLKMYKPILEQFLKHGIPLLEQTFRRHQSDTVSILKTLQISTRYIQVICTSSKTDQDISLANHVPHLKKVLEAMVFRVQAMMAANNCGDAFWLGNLKNRDLEGEEILSQVEEEGEEEEEAAEESRHEDDDEGEEDEGEADRNENDAENEITLMD